MNFKKEGDFIVRGIIIAGTVALSTLLTGTDFTLSEKSNAALSAVSSRFLSENDSISPDEIHSDGEKIKGVPKFFKRTFPDISECEQFGLIYDSALDGYCYNGKLVGFFIDEGSNFRTTSLNNKGEIHIKTVRNENNELIGLAELTEDEYNQVIAESEKRFGSKKGGMKPDFGIQHNFSVGSDGMFGTIPGKIFNFKGGCFGLSRYEQYGLIYDEEQNGYLYNGKLVGTLVDEQSRMFISCLNKNGEVNVKAVYNENNELTGLTELSEEEYNKIISELESKKAEFEEQKKNMMEEIERMFSESFDNFSITERNGLRFPSLVTADESL